MPYIQIAGVRSKEEALMIASEGVPFLGFPLKLGYHKEDIDLKEAAEIIRSLPGTCSPVLITYLDNALEISDLADYLKVKIIQLHGKVLPESIYHLKKINPGYFIIKSIIIGKPGNFNFKNFINEYSTVVDAYITDSYDSETGATGATGIVHDWEISREIVRLSKKPVILAGGLKADNVEDAVKRVKPFGVDSHTGVENNEGWKDREKVRMFFLNAMRSLSKYVFTL